jgi:hypothetical protein
MILPGRTSIELAAAVLAIAGAIFGHSIWLEEHDDKLRATAELAAEKKAFDALAADRKTHEAADAARDQAAAKQLETMAAMADKIRTPAQIASWLPQQLPGIPQPIQITVPQPTAQNPHPDAIASIPQSDLPYLRDTVEKCREDAVRLTTCQGNLSSRVAQMKEADGQIKALQGQVGSLQTELAGGTFWTRTKRAAKFLAIGGGIAVAATCGTGHCK